MSALEQMELFEKRLKVQAKRKPEKEEKAEGFEIDIDSNRARTINNQMDWECGECGQFNFARTITCHSCKRHVDTDTKYLTNRLKEMKCAAPGQPPSRRTPSFAPRVLPPPHSHTSTSTPHVPFAGTSASQRSSGTTLCVVGFHRPTPTRGKESDTTGLGVRVSAFRAQKRTYLNMAASIEAPQGRGEETQYVKCV